MPSPLVSESYDVVRGFARRVWVNPARLTLDLKLPCDVIACGAGSLGSMIARRLAENPEVSALVEAGGNDAAADVLAIHRWESNGPSGTGRRFP